MQTHGELDTMSEAFSTWLNFFRWLAAFAVLITHTENVLLVFVVDLPPSERAYAHYAYAFLAGFARQAVMMFFVISGFLVGGGLWDEMRKRGTVDLLSYFVKRMVRLWIVIIPTLFVILLFDFAGIVVFDGLRNGIFDSDIFSKLSPVSFLCNAAFLQTAACWEYGADGSLWSLYNEFWYYCIWPPMILALLPILSISKRAFCIIGTIVGLIVLTYLQFSGVWFAPYMCIWLMGALVSAIEKPFVRSSIVSGLIFVGWLLATRLSIRRGFIEHHQFYGLIVDLVTGATFSNLLLSLKCSGVLRKPFGNDLHRRLAGFSFSLYCIHVPILMLYASVLMLFFGIGSRMKPSGVITWIIVMGALVTCVVAAYGFSMTTEAKTGQIRRWIFDRLPERLRPIKLHFVE
jgi:peptidoglycan/LPS O-acetylase OafA/YrhL